MPTNLAHSLLLIIASAGTFLWLTSPVLAPYTLQLVAILILIYASFHWFRPTKRRRLNTIPLDLTLLTVIILLLVVETGTLTSPFIFLIYFLLFAVAILFEIEATLLLTGTLLVFFLLFPGTNLSDLAHLSELLALIMVTPLALFTAHQYEIILAEKLKTKTLTAHLAREETDTLLFLTTNLKSTLTSALDLLSITIPQAKVQSVRHDLQILYQDLSALYRSADELKQVVDQETDH